MMQSQPSRLSLCWSPRLAALLLCAMFVAAVSPRFCRAQAGSNPHLLSRTRYTIQAGDRIEVNFRYTPELNETVTVQPDGYITLEPTGDLKVGQLTVAQATSLIAQRSSAHLKDPKVTLTLKEFHKPFYVVAGEVKHPGRYDMDNPTTAYQAYLSAGGPEADAQASQVLVFRRLNAENDEVRVLDLHKMRKARDLEHDLMLEPGDMILVPHDRISKIDRIIKASNIGLYFNPTSLGL